MIAIYGPAGVGKTTLAAALAQRLDVPVRHCGVALKRAAEVAGVRAADATRDLHTLVDEETRAFARTVLPLGVVEGRYLRFVLAGLPYVRFIQLRCAGAVRADRRSRSDQGAVASEDAADAKLIAELYAPHDPGAASEDWLQLDSTNTSSADLVTLIQNTLQRL